MSHAWKYTDSDVRLGQTQGERPASSASGGVEVRLQGWRTGLNKVQLTKTFREGGAGLAEASRMTGALLDGEVVRVRLAQFDSVESARSALERLGVETVRESD
jgi:hypothetical protein